VKADSPGSKLSRSYPKPALAAKTVSAGLLSITLLECESEQEFSSLP